MKNNFTPQIVYFFKNRFVLFSSCLAIFTISYFISYGLYLPSAEIKDLWFYSGLFMVLFSILFIEPYYTSPKNVITNVIPLLLVFLSIKESFKNSLFWWFAVGTFVALLLMSIGAMVIENKEKSPAYRGNKIADFIKNWAVFIGRGKVLYSAVFIYLLLTYHSIQNLYTLVLFIFWFCIIAIDAGKVHNNFILKSFKKNTNQIGEIFSVQSKKVFLIKLFKDRSEVEKFDLVNFRYSMQETRNCVITGIVFDTYFLNQEKWAKVLQLKESRGENVNLERDIVYKISDEEKIAEISAEMRVDDFVGVISERSTIGKIIFEYSTKNVDVQEGDLIELKVGSRTLYYQIIEGITEKENLEARNESGFIKGEAIQLGEWCGENLSFQKFGWVPSINTPIFKADTSNITVEAFEYPEYKLGTIPGTTLPSVIDLNDAISHHIAMIGVTGSGKSFLARKIIKEIQRDTKIICVDLTGEWKEELSELNPVPLIDAAGLPGVEAEIASKEAAVNARTKNPDVILKYKQSIQEKLNGYVKKFAEAENNIGIFELPDLSNTSFILEFTQMFLESVFTYAKQNKGSKFCIVLEEAHTIIPETSFLGDLGDYGSNKGLVSKMGQIALQGRKYGVGLLVIAQRTANVSKTVLTQCNTVICFQAFDETSFAFLGNYVGKDMIHALPNLKQYQAIVAGKAIKSNVPMIIDLKE